MSARASEVEPATAELRAELAKIDVYFASSIPVDDLPTADRDWVQRDSLPTLYAEVQRLRGVVARLEADRR